MRFSRVIAVAGLLGIGGLARAESQVPLNYVDDFGNKSTSFTSEAGATVPTPDRDTIASVNGANAAAIEASGAGLTSIVSAPSPDRERVASVNGPDAGGVSRPTSTATTGIAVARQSNLPR